MIKKSFVGATAALLLSLAPAEAQNVTNQVVNVDCGAGQKIQPHLNLKTRARRLIITITGTCNENLTVSRDDVIIKGPTPGARNATIRGSVGVTGSQRIEFLHLRIINGPSVGLTVKRGSSVLIRNVGISGQPSVALSILRMSVVQLENSYIAAPATAADTIEVVDNSVLQMTNTSVIANRVESGFGSAIGVYRGSALRMWSGNTLTHNGAPQADEFTASVIMALDNANVRVQNTGNTCNGNVAIGDGSTADLRDSTFTGNIFAHRMSLIEFRNTTTIIGSVRAGTRSLIDYKGAAQTGTASCFQERALRNVPAGVTPNGCTIF